MQFDIEQIKKIVSKFHNSKEILSEFLKYVVVSDEVTLFNRTLSNERLALRHRFVKTIQLKDIQYNMLVQIADDAVEFCKLFELSYVEGFQKYCQLGLKFIGNNYAINKFKTYKEKIFREFERDLVKNLDDDQSGTFQLIHYYFNKCNLSGEDTLLSIYDMYGHDFVYLRLQILENEADAADWVNAQFESFKSFNKIPEPYQLHGDEAYKRYRSVKPKSKEHWSKKAKIRAS